MTNDPANFYIQAAYHESTFLMCKSGGCTVAEFEPDDESVTVEKLSLLLMNHECSKESL